MITNDIASIPIQCPKYYKVFWMLMAHLSFCMACIFIFPTHVRPAIVHLFWHISLQELVKRDQQLSTECELGNRAKIAVLYCVSTE